MRKHTPGIAVLGAGIHVHNFGDFGRVVNEVMEASQINWAQRC